MLYGITTNLYLEPKSESGNFLTYSELFRLFSALKTI